MAFISAYVCHCPQIVGQTLDWTTNDHPVVHCCHKQTYSAFCKWELHKGHRTACHRTLGRTFASAPCSPLQIAADGVCPLPDQTAQNRSHAWGQALEALKPFGWRRVLTWALLDTSTDSGNVSGCLLPSYCDITVTLSFHLKDCVAAGNGRKGYNPNYKCIPH